MYDMAIYFIMDCSRFLFPETSLSCADPVSHVRMTPGNSMTCLSWWAFEAKESMLKVHLTLGIPHAKITCFFRWGYVHDGGLVLFRCLDKKVAFRDI